MGSLFYIYPKIAVCALRCCGMFAALLADRQQRNGIPSAALSQTVSSIIANRQQHYRKPSAAVGADLSCPRI